jgi:hypothetical protein
MSVQSVTLGTSYGGGAIHLVLYRPIARIDINVAYGGGQLDPISLGLPQMYTDSCPMLIFNPSATTASVFWSQLNYAQG